MVPSATALALCLALLLACPTHGEELPSPRAVRFAARTGWHLLRWEPGHGCPSDARYEVEYIVYGAGTPWTAVPGCRNTSEHSCDLTRYTPDPERRYHARVRAVAGNHTSSWQRTHGFFPQQAGVHLVGQSLSVMGNSIQVRLLLHAGNTSLEHSDFQKEMTRYHVYIRRTRDNHTVTMVKNSTEFTLRELFWVTEYCLSVEPSMAHRPVPARRSGEQCITTGHRDRSAELLPDILSSSFIILSLLGLLGALLACTYIRKPVRTPSALKSFMKQSSLWLEHEPPSSGSLDADPIQQLFLCQKEPQLGGSPGSSTSTAQLPLEQGWMLPAWPKDQLGPVGSRDSSSTSTDSGICLHVPSSSSSSSSSSLSCSTGPEPQGYRQQLPTAEDSGAGLESPCPAPGNASPGQPGLCPATGQADVEFRGYLQQSKGTVEPQRAPGKAEPLSGRAGSVQGLGSTDTVLDMECSELAVSKGYLKQSSPEHPLTQDLAAWGAPSCDFSSQVGLQGSTLLSWAAPGAPLTPKASPDLKTPFDLNIFNNAAFPGTLLLVPSLSSSWITALGQLSGDSKDSHL
ncbi:Interleukin-10 receptor subunit alpha [Lonchura striata]|uniref:Interleukin-10 receptor subunit alpha n=1 Tax=Lonchura striata TaxID=40157 RepID=A0A218UQ10_9PASE|nr:interleukin-10 receptor subunit alpha [Lonchura striata domestica]OWK55698.1 Interleukin-10 receptor subunit alpha [Lonchura striata domestica]